MRHAAVQSHFGLALVKIEIMVLAAASLAMVQPARGKNIADDGVSQLVGSWAGDSICQVRPSACHDEKALYKIAKSPEGSGNVVRITACKIVDGREVTMGSSDWSYDKEKGTLLWDGPAGVWRLFVQGNSMHGTLTLPDKTIFRRVTLKKVE